MYTTLSDHYRAKFGCKVYKLSIDGGFTCPNRDGTLGVGGCIFCSAAGSGEFAAGPAASISDQLEKAKARVSAKNKGGKYIAYFQSFTNTYASVEILREKYLAAIAPDDIVGLAIGTRPDCLPESTLALLCEINQIKPVTVELGLQTVHEASISYIRRGYVNQTYFDAVARLKAAHIEVVTQIIRVCIIYRVQIRHAGREILIAVEHVNMRIPCHSCHLIGVCHHRVIGQRVRIRCCRKDRTGHQDDRDGGACRTNGPVEVVMPIHQLL